MNCTGCGYPLKTEHFLGGETMTYCPNMDCPSHFTDVKCPACGGTDKFVKTLGIGHQIFKCKKCKHQWSSI